MQFTYNSSYCTQNIIHIYRHAAWKTRVFQLIKYPLLEIYNRTTQILQGNQLVYFC